MSQKQKKIQATSTVDCHNASIAPLDYSFMELGNCKDALEEDPRINSPRKTPRSNKKKELEKEEEEEKPKSKTRSIKFNNNALNDIGDMRSTIEGLCEDPDGVWALDLSFNGIANVDPISQCPELRCLYLHSNLINDMKEVDKLACLPNLKKLTLHGNPIETIKDYRWQVLAKIPALLSLDFSCVTKEDRAKAAAPAHRTGNKKAKKRGADA